MKNKLKILSILLLSNMFLGLAQVSSRGVRGIGEAGAGGGPGTGGPRPEAPIDTNEFILIIAAVLLTVGVMAYKKLSLKKA